MIGTVAATAAGRAMAQRLAAAWPGEVTVHGGPVGEQFRAAWEAGGAIVCFLATGAAVRLAAPLLAGKHTDPAVVCVDEAGRFAVALLGGHARPGAPGEVAPRPAGYVGVSGPVAAPGLVAGGAALSASAGDVGGAGSPGEGVPPGSAVGEGAAPADAAAWALSGGANALAVRVAGVLGAQPVVTTATDAVGLSPLDTFGADLGFRLADAAPVARVTRALLDGAPLRVAADAQWPVPPLPTAADAAHTITVSDRRDAGGDLVYRPPSLVVGVGSSRGVPADELDALVEAALADAGLAPESVRALATVDLKAGEAGIVDLARRRRWPLVTYPAADLATEEVPNPSDVVRAAVGTASVAEAAALRAARAAGRTAEIVVPKRASAMGTVAVARLVPRGRLTLIGLGPGADDLRTPRATAALRRAAVVVGLDQYVDQVRHLLAPGTRVIVSGLGAEEERARTAVELATAGHAVALLGSGDAGIYAMASPALQLAGPDVEVDSVPGVTAALAAAALVGAPLGHDHAYLSLSDVHTPWPVIADRLRACAEADLVVCLYNPRSARRTAQFAEALAILSKHRPDGTPVAVVRDATREGEQVLRTSLAELVADPSIVDMRCTVLVGSSRTVDTGGRMVTPREYRWLS